MIDIFVRLRKASVIVPGRDIYKSSSGLSVKDAIDAYAEMIRLRRLMIHFFGGGHHLDLTEADSDAVFSHIEADSKSG